ncbi:hypothetical protein K469DRAFT_59164 [Zopfia rhizophila CBS 207.26]|uniref:Uncharacterized protein n=1 Tax=Zopfia rhizophila CBS 207.26 TaxID=1314779 RepID=A0A6A6EGB9_9PEZI|nr:hypothetical protein K469DRAFT_59164 [Zopfia rhizophila CBS 207.26]
MCRMRPKRCQCPMRMQRNIKPHKPQLLPSVDPVLLCISMHVFLSSKWRQGVNFISVCFDPSSRSVLWELRSSDWTCDASMRVVGTVRLGNYGVRQLKKAERPSGDSPLKLVDVLSWGSSLQYSIGTQRLTSSVTLLKNLIKTRTMGWRRLLSTVHISSVRIFSCPP